MHTSNNEFHQLMIKIKLIKYLLPFFLILFAFSLWHREADVDDAWIGEHAYWLAEKGFVKSELMHGITDQQNRHIVHHKLLNLNGYAFIKLFGYSLYTLKSVSLLWLISFLVILYYYTRHKYSRNLAWFAVLLTCANALVFQFSFTYRPEIMVMTLGFVSFIFTEKYLLNNNKLFLIPAGIAAGLAAAAHLNGLIFIGSTTLVLLIKRKPIGAVLAGIYALIGFAVYFYDFSTEYNFDFWYYQISYSPALNQDTVMPTTLAYVLKVLGEHMRFFHSPKEISLTVLTIVSLILCFSDLKRKTLYPLYLLISIVLLSLISVHATSKYLLLYLPYMLLIVIHTLNRLETDDFFTPSVKIKYAKYLAFLILFYFSVNAVYNVLTARKKFDVANNSVITDKYYRENAKDLTILAPMNFVFNEIPKYKRIQSDLSIEEMNKMEPISGDQFFHKMDDLQIDALLLSDEYLKKFGLEQYDSLAFSKNGFVRKGVEMGGDGRMLTIYDRIISK